MNKLVEQIQMYMKADGRIKIFLCNKTTADYIKGDSSFLSGSIPGYALYGTLFDKFVFSTETLPDYVIIGVIDKDRTVKFNLE